MSNLIETKKKMGNLLKTYLSKLILPGEISKKVSTKMRLEANLELGCKAIIACAEVKGGRPPGNYGLYWLLSLSNGPIYEVMQATNSDQSQSFSGNIIFRGTSHNLKSGASHYEITSETDLEATVSIICSDIKKICFPIVQSFNLDFLDAIEFVKNNGTGYVRNPFTACIILLGLSKSLNRIDEIISIAKDNPSFYDFHASPNYKAHIIDPIVQWFEQHGK